MISRAKAWVALLAGVALLTGCGTGAAQQGQAQLPGMSAASQAAQANPNLDPGTSLGGQPAPDIRLDNQFGQPMSLSQFRGKVVILAFTDSQCTTVCPLTTASMLQAKQLLGSAGASVQLLGVNANEQFNSVADVLEYSRVHGMVNQWDFLTGSGAQLRATWSAYHIAVQVERGLIDHTPALFVIDQRGREQKIYLTQMAYSSVGQSAQVLAQEVASLLPGHPRLASQQSLATIASETPTAEVTLPAAVAGAPVALGPGHPRLVLFFATWLSEVSDLRSELTGLNSYEQAVTRDRLPQLVAVDETVAEPSAQGVRAYLRSLGLRYQAALDITGQLADGYGVQDQPWFVLVSASGKIIWSHGGWLTVQALEASSRRA